MKKSLVNWLATIGVAATGLTFAAPSEVREWTSASGTKITASAVQLKDEFVQLKTADGRLLTVSMNDLSEDDRSFIIRHFGLDGIVAETGKPLKSGSEPATGLAHPQGEVVGPLDAGDGSTYFVYLPNSLRQDRQAALMIFTGAGGGKAGSVASHIEGAELNGWIVAACVESKNGNDFEVNHRYAKQCYEHLQATLPIEPGRVYFTGGSGGGAMAFHNAAHLPSAGAMPLIGYIPNEAPGGGHFFVVNGTTDYNRYTSAHAAERFGKDAIHRFHVGGHAGGPDWLLHEGMAWLNGRFLADQAESHPDERLDYEFSMIEWIRKLIAEEPHRAYYWARFLQDDYGIAGHNATVVEGLVAELGAGEMNRRYAEGIAAIDEFSSKHYAAVSGGSQMGHTTPEITRAAESLAAEYAGVPQIEDIARALGEATVGGGKKK